MIHESTVRMSVWLTVPFNIVGAIAFAFPTSLPGKLVGLPEAPMIYTVFVGLLIALFGAKYAWIAWQPVINRPLLAFGAVAKIAVAVVSTWLWFNGECTLPMLLAASGDLAFGVFWLAWLRSSRPSLDG